MPRFFLTALLSALTCAGLAQSITLQKTPSSNSTIGFVAASGTYFLDGSGQPLLFHGVNVVNKSKEQGYTGNISAADFALIRSWGLNAVRLCIFWDGIEPQPGHYDETYLDRIAKLVGYAKQQGIYVLLDMHQDLYSVKFSDGAPLWATLDEGKPHTAGAEWSDEYYISSDVQTALDHFWANSPGPDGVGLQDHYAKAWQHVAQRFRNEPDVIGYDLMNEPFPGRDASHVRQASLTRLSELLAKRPQQPHPSPEQLIAMEATTEGREQVVKWMRDLALFKGMLEAATPIMKDFERTRLVPMYSRVRKSIRQVDSRHILFLEPAMSANLGIRSALTPLVDDQGKRDPQQAYAPHVYDIVMDKAYLDLTSNDRIALIIRRHGEFSKRTQMPLLVGEWGGFKVNPADAEPAIYIAQQLDALGCGDMYWAYSKELASWPGLAALEMHARKQDE